MKLFFVLAALSVLILSALLFLSVISRNKRPLPGLINNRLQPCNNTSNCVCSEASNNSTPNSIAVPFEFPNTSPADAWHALTDTIKYLNGHIIEQRDDYLWAVFNTPFFGFADDFEARLDIADRKIHIRSASRVGFSDFGANRKRVHHIHLAFLNRLQ